MPTQTETRPSATTERRSIRRFTREEYEHMIEAGVLGPDDRCELLEGEIVDKMPQSSRHFTIISLTENALRAAYREAHYALRVQGPMALGDESAPEPDVAVVRGTPRDYVDAHPTTALLVVEVSDTSFADDRTRKKRVYARAGVTEYWIVNLAEAALEVYRAPNEGGYDRRETLRPPASVSPPQADAEIAVADLLP